MFSAVFRRSPKKRSLVISYPLLLYTGDPGNLLGKCVDEIKILIEEAPTDLDEENISKYMVCSLYFGYFFFEDSIISFIGG